MTTLLSPAAVERYRRDGWGLSEPDVVTAWLAFTDATVDNGAMRMVPGSHGEQLAHRDTFAPNNLLSRGQEIAVEVDEARGVDILLRGVDDYHHFVPEQAPASDLGSTARAHHAEAVARSAKILYRGTGVERFR